ncbi:MAG: phosphotransferase [Mariprofundales bacterium]
MEVANPIDTDRRQQQVAAWLGRVLGSGVELAPLAGDASFRRYFRALRRGERWVVMDAPPEKESVAPFLAVRSWLDRIGMRVPALIAVDEEAGLLLLEDLGDTTWAKALEAGNAVEPLFDDALRQLHLLHAADASALNLPPFDKARMERECALYLDWYLPNIVGKSMRSGERAQFFVALEPLLDRIVNLPQVPIHLDFHSRNLMLVNDAPPLGVIDFQDACIGPLGYDIASLIYDCYQDYDTKLAYSVSVAFYAQLPQGWRRQFADAEAWHASLLATSLQRHIKVCGIFSRLAFRDGKRQFLDNLPQTRRHLACELDALGTSVAALKRLMVDDLLDTTPSNHKVSACN